MFPFFSDSIISPKCIPQGLRLGDFYLHPDGPGHAENLFMFAQLK